MLKFVVTDKKGNVYRCTKNAPKPTIANPTKADIIDERARELAWECHRRSDLVRFGLLTTSDYLWSHKGMNSNVGTPHAVDSKYNLYPLASSDVISNSENLEQNDGY